MLLGAYDALMGIARSRAGASPHRSRKTDPAPTRVKRVNAVGVAESTTERVTRSGFGARGLNATDKTER